MAAQDTGWIQLFAETNQEAADLHIQAFRLAEELSVPVMVCMDGFILTHATERVDLPSQQQVDAYLPPFEPRQVLDPDEPISIGAMVGPEAFEEVRYLAHLRQLQALARIEELAAEFAEAFGRDSGGQVHPYRSADADIVVIALGSVLGTIKDLVDSLRDEGMRIGVLGITSFRPFPIDAVRVPLPTLTASSWSRRPSASASAASSQPMWRWHLPVSRYRWRRWSPALAAGRSPRPRSGGSSSKLTAENSERLTFLDLNRHLIERELEREMHRRRSGPAAENILRDVGTVASGIG